jgi:hypothetical protein
MAGLREAFQNKTGQFAPAKKSDPVIAALSSDINSAITHCEDSDSSMESYRLGDYSFASIEDVLTPDKFISMVNTDLSTLLDSGASSHIINDVKYFWNTIVRGPNQLRRQTMGPCLL